MTPAEIGWTFDNERLLAAACSGAGLEFQRLEFLGDAIADAVLVPWMYRWSTGTVALLAGARQQLTSDATLGRLALLTGLHMVLPPDLRAVPERPGDLIEAIVGAAFLDGGWPAATAVCEAVFGPWLVEPHGVSQHASRIDTVVDRHNSRWRWRYRLWTDRSPTPNSGTGVADDLVGAEIEALTVALEQLGRTTPSVWIEMSDDLRAEMSTTEITDHTPAIQTLRALLAAYDGVWVVPSERIDTSLPLWNRSSDEPDGVLTGFEQLAGHDLKAEALERLALCPGPEQRRLAFVGNVITKSAATIAAYRTEPTRNEAHLTSIVRNTVALARLHRTALDLGLTDLLLPGERPAHPTEVIRAALGAVAIDAGTEHAIDIATRWVTTVRVRGRRVGELCTINCTYDTSNGPLVVHTELTTPTRHATWEFHDPTLAPLARATEGICTAIDTLSADEADLLVVINAPQRLTEALDEPTKVNDPATRSAISRLLHRIDERSLTAAWGPQR